MLTLFIEQLTVIDCSFLCPERGLVGESWLVDMELSGDTTHEGVIADFSEIKHQVKRFIDEQVDHKLLLPSLSKQIRIEREGSRCDMSFEGPHGFIHCEAPLQGMIGIDAESIDAEAVARYLEEHLIPELPDNAKQVKLKLYPDPALSEFYHYSHGLKQHSGNCQRIAHGHRSPLSISIDGERDVALESQWIERFKDQYLAFDEDLIQSYSEQGCDYHRFGYTAAQGYFELSLPQASCYIMDTDTTVEHISLHICEQIKAQRPKQSVRVKAFEGYRKGSITLL